MLLVAISTRVFFNEGIYLVSTCDDQLVFKIENDYLVLMLVNQLIL
jgi:hypothetical protein